MSKMCSLCFRMDQKLIFCTSLLFALAYPSSDVCSSDCTCFLDKKGRYTVQCQKGGLIGPINLDNMNPSMEVLKITAPENNMNLLTMSPDIQNFLKLEEVHVTRSNIPILGKHFFYGLRKLEVLNLSQNNITQPLDHNFRGLEHLKELYLDDNRIISLPSGTFRYLKELKVLSIQRNRIQELMPRMFYELSKLSVLKLSGNNMNVLPKEVFMDIRELRVLECRGCSLKTVDKELYEEIKYLVHLDLGDNEIETIASDEFESLNKLRGLKLDGNQINHVFEYAFGRQFALKKLSLARNDLTKLSKNVLYNLKNLTELDLGYNKIDSLEEGFLEYVEDGLEKLILSGNHFTAAALKILLVNLVSLVDLQLADVGITDLSNRFLPEDLNTLNLAGNHLSYLPVFALPGRLVELDLSGNRFRGLDEDAVRRIEGIKWLKLDNNPWSCDLCHIVSLLARVNRSSAIHDIKCATPYSSRGRVLGTVQREQLSWCGAPSFTSSDANFFLTGDEGKVGIIAASASVLLLFLTVAAVVAALCYSRRHAANYYTHEDKRAPGEAEAIVENQSPLFGEDRELSFKFPLDLSEKKISIATIDEIKKDHAISNGT